MSTFVKKVVVAILSFLILIGIQFVDVNAASQAELEKEYQSLYNDYAKAVKKHAKEYVDELKWYENPTGCDTVGTFLDGDCLANSIQKEGMKRADKEYKDKFEKMKKKFGENGLSFSKPSKPYPKAYLNDWNPKAVVLNEVIWGEVASVSTKVDKTKGKKVLVASQGMFTKTDVQTYGSCDVSDVKQKMAGQVGEPKIIDTSAVKSSNDTSSSSDSSSKDDSKTDTKESENSKKSEEVSNSPKIPFTGIFSKDKIGQAMGETFKKFAQDIQGNLFGTDCDNNTLSVVGQFLNISRPLNLTDNQYVMKLVHVTQQIAFTMTIVIIAFYALMYTTGFHNTDPVKFGVRLFFCLLAVNYLPWLMQDILNLNNEIVYNVSTLKFTFDDATGNSTELIMGAFTAIFESFVMGENIGKSLLLLIFAFVMAIVAIVPMLKIISRWYIRLLRLFLAAVVGPMLVILGALPQTADKAQTWLKTVIGQIFEQVFVALGLLLVAVILGNIGDFGDTLGIGWFGRGILIYACIFFLADVPSFAGTFLKTLSGGNSDKMSKGVNGMLKGTRNAAVGTAIGGVAAGYALSGNGLPNKGISSLIVKGKGAKVGHAFGHTALGGGKAVGKGVKSGIANTKDRASRFKAGYDSGFVGGSVNSPKVKGVSGIAGAVAGRVTNKGNQAYNKGSEYMDGVSKNVSSGLKKAGDARVSTQLAASMGVAAASNAVKQKKENLKEGIKNMKGTVQSGVNDKVGRTMKNMYKEAYGKDMKSVNEESARQIGNIANNRGTAGGTDSKAHQPRKSNSSTIKNSTNKNISTKDSSTSIPTPLSGPRTSHQTHSSTDSHRETDYYNPHELGSGFDFTFPETPKKTSKKNPTRTPKKNNTKKPPDSPPKK